MPATEVTYDKKENAYSAAVIVYDAMTSASARLGSTLPNIDKYTISIDGKNHLVYKGFSNVRIAMTKALYDSILAAQAEGKECANAVLSYVDADTVVTNTPDYPEYKVLLPDGTLSKTVTETYVDTDASCVIEANARYGEYLITVSGIDVPDENLLVGVVLTATSEDGTISRYGMKPVGNFYRNAQANMIAFCVTDGFKEFRDSAVRQYKYTVDLAGQTITEITYLLKDAADLVIETNLPVKQQITDPYDSAVLTSAVSIANAQWNDSAITTTVSFQNLPEDYDCDLSALLMGTRNITEMAAWDKENKELTITQDGSIVPGSYTAYFSDDTYINVSAAFTIESGMDAADVQLQNNQLVIEDSRYNIEDYMNAITAITVNGKTCSGTTFKKNIFFTEDGYVKFDAATTTRGTTTTYFPVEETTSYDITITASGYPQAQVHTEYQTDLETSLSAEKLEYNGSAQKPEVIVKDANGTVLPPAYYTLAYEDEASTEAGEYKVTANFQNGYQSNSAVELTYTIALHEHNYINKVTPATLCKDGKVKSVCEGCGKVKSTKTIYRPAIYLPYICSYIPCGNVKVPALKIYDIKGKVISSSNYSVKVSCVNKFFGKYKYTITFKNNYSGTKSMTFYVLAIR